MRRSILTLPILLLLAVMMIGFKADYAKAEVTTGDCGVTEGTVTWTYDDETDVLTISGTGAIKDYSDTDTSDFRTYRATVKTIYMESGITAVGQCAFYGFSVVTVAIFSDTVESIGSDAFTGCSMIKFLGPSDLELIQKYAYYNNITYVEGGTCGADGANVVWEYNEDWEGLIFYGTGAMKDYKFGDSSDFMIKKYKAEYISIKEGITHIGDYAFSNFTKINSILINDSVVSLGEGAFTMCFELKQCNMSESITEIPDEAFSGCMYLDTLGADNITKIGNSAFYGCSRLKNINTASLKYIGDKGFMKCSILEKLVLPDDMEYIGKYAFDDCDNLVLYVNADTIGHQYAIDNNIKYNLLKGEFEAKEGTLSYEYDIETSTLKISGNGAMKDYENVSDSAFYGFGDNIKIVEIGEGVTYIGSNAFGNNCGITNVTIADTVTEIGEKAFYNSNKIISLELPKNLKNIGDYAFCGCSNIWGEVVIPDSVLSIGDYAFYGCDSLARITIGTGVTSIGRWSFYGCSYMTAAIIPENVASIGEYAFDACEELTIYTSEGTVADSYAKENEINVSYEDAPEEIIETTGGALPEASKSPETSASPEASKSPEASASPEASKSP
ncbi:MAG: leucine-rich repeat protein, partial [Lachnospiraceae bacterium]|nr:leucine-rich repeat protein [Lachnospiraceae bacterium]